MPKIENLLPCPRCNRTEGLTREALQSGLKSGYRRVRCDCGYIGPGRNDTVQAVKAFNRVKRDPYCTFCRKAHPGGDTCMGHYP